MPNHWITFATAPASVAGHSHISHYEVTACRAISGPAPAIAIGAPFLRVESDQPVTLGASHEFHGIVQHQNYTATWQRPELASIGPMPDAHDLHCVLIPIHKTDAWWDLPADQRTACFHQNGAHHQHAAIGAPYVQRIHRRLFHSRYQGGAEAPTPYDFLTYFEFPDSERAAFEDLLAGLRDTARNPEWAYVDGEFEIWLRRTIPR